MHQPRRTGSDRCGCYRLVGISSGICVPLLPIRINDEFSFDFNLFLGIRSQNKIFDDQLSEI
jgi:hypothetical protein